MPVAAKGSGRVHFGLCGQGIVNLAREAYWFEDNKQWARNVLSCFRGMLANHVDAILSGDATLSDMDEDGLVHYIAKEDLEFKERLRKHQQWIDSQCVDLAGHRVPVRLLDQYAEHVVGRLRAITRVASRVVVLPTEMLLQVPALEELRTQLHGEILDAIGLSRTHPDYWKFDNALTEYVDEKAGPWIPKEV